MANTLKIMKEMEDKAATTRPTLLAAYAAMDDAAGYARYAGYEAVAEKARAIRDAISELENELFTAQFGE